MREGLALLSLRIPMLATVSGQSKTGPAGESWRVVCQTGATAAQLICNHQVKGSSPLSGSPQRQRKEGSAPVPLRLAVY